MTITASIMTPKCPSLVVRQWLSSRPIASTILLGPPAVEARFAGESQGLGLFATRSIEAFSQVLADRPLVLMKPDDDLPELYHQFVHLSEGDREEYLSLSQHTDPNRNALLQDRLLQRGFGKDALEEMANVAGIMQTNAFNVDINDGQGSRHRALFPRIARINHSCAPNAHVCCYYPGEDQPQGRMVVHALKDLQPGEEVLISYFSILLPRSERQAKTQKWGFTCVCPVCSGGEDDEDQRQTIRGFNEEQGRILRRTKATMEDIDAAVKKGHALIRNAWVKPELYPALPELSESLGMLHNKASSIEKPEYHRAKAVSFLNASAIWEARITGSSSPATGRRLRNLAQFAEKNDRSTQQIVTGEDGRYVVQ